MAHLMMGSKQRKLYNKVKHSQKRQTDEVSGLCEIVARTHKTLARSSRIQEEGYKKEAAERQEEEKYIDRYLFLISYYISIHVLHFYNFILRQIV